MNQRILQDTDDYQVIEETDPAAGYRGVRIQYKRGTRPANREAVVAKLATQQVAARRYAQPKEWAGLSAPQKLDTAIPLLLQMMANLTALVLDTLDDEGI